MSFHSPGTIAVALFPPVIMLLLITYRRDLIPVLSSSSSASSTTESSSDSAVGADASVSAAATSTAADPVSSSSSAAAAPSAAVPEEANVLIAEDERELADLFATWLESEYSVQTAYRGQSALELVDEDTDVVLLDRRMPELHGDEVLEEIQKRGLDCTVAMVTAVDPDFDIIEKGFDDYINKPVEQEELHDVVERMLAFGQLSPGAQEYYTKLSKKSALESDKSQSELESHDGVEALNQGIEAYDGVITSLAEETIKASLDGTTASADAEEPVELEKWKDRVRSLNENDPLYDVAMERIQELERQHSGAGGDMKQEFLAAVAQEFIAEGLWLAPTVRRALNLTLYNTDQEEFTINDQPLEDLAQASTSSKFDASQEVRQLARQELDSTT